MSNQGDFASAIDTLSARGGQEDDDLRRAIAASLADTAPSGGDNDEYIETSGADSDDTDAGPVNLISETRLSAAATTLDNNFPLGSGLSLRGQAHPRQSTPHAAPVSVHTLFALHANTAFSPMHVSSQ